MAEQANCAHNDGGLLSGESSITLTKICCDCGDEKPITDFGIRRNQKDGHNYYCKSCNSAQSSDYARRNLAKIRYRTNLWRSLKQEYWMIQRAKSRANKSGIEFAITEHDIIIPEFCPVLGIRLKRSNVRGGTHNSPSLDRIKPELGYVKGNVAVISWRANSLKKDATSDEIFKVAKWLRTLEDEQNSQFPKSVCTEVLPNLTFTRHEVR
jgi:hypothetical protein